MRFFRVKTKKKSGPIERRISKKRVNKSWRSSASGTTQIKRAESVIAKLEEKLSLCDNESSARFEKATKKLLEAKLQAAKNGLTIAESIFNHNLAEVKEIDSKNFQLSKKYSSE